MPTMKWVGFGALVVIVAAGIGLSSGAFTSGSDQTAAVAGADANNDAMIAADLARLDVEFATVAADLDALVKMPGKTNAVTAVAHLQNDATLLQRLTDKLELRLTGKLKTTANKTLIKDAEDDIASANAQLAVTSKVVTAMTAPSKKQLEDVAAQLKAVNGFLQGARENLIKVSAAVKGR